jgi:hypothetical protein
LGELRGAVILEKLIFTDVVKKFSAFYGTRKNFTIHKSGHMVRVLVQTNTAGKPYTQLMKIRLKCDIQRIVHRDIFL